jgi:anti-sigma factor RsiW
MNRTPCPDFELLLARAADESLADPDRARLEAHLVTCQNCRDALADQKAIREALLDRPALRAQPADLARSAGFPDLDVAARADCRGPVARDLDGVAPAGGDGCPTERR